MLLTPEQIREFTTGAIHITHTDGIYCFDRFTQSQYATWDTIDPSFGEGARCSTGIAIDFHTDSESMLFWPGNNGKYEVLINGLCSQQVIRQSQGKWCAHLGTGDKRVTLVLPSHSAGKLNCIVLDEGSRVWRHEYARKILFFGDSITQGWDAHWDSLSYSWQVTRFLDADALNQAIGGTWYSPEALEPLPFDPDIVVVSYGANDFKHFSSPEALQEACGAYLAKIREQYGDKKVFCITPIWRADCELVCGPGKLSNVSAIIRNESEKQGFVTVDGMELVPHLEECYADFYLHPNSLGFGLYAINLVQKMLPHL